jgi:hypothetical protein
MKRLVLPLMLSLALSSPARAHHPNASDASALSMLPIAVSVAAPAMLLSAGAMLTVVAIEASAAGVVCILERAFDGARASVTLSAHGAAALSIGVGTVVSVSAFSAGWVLSAAGRAIAYIPNEIGAALLYNERVTR